MVLEKICTCDHVKKSNCDWAKEQKIVNILIILPHRGILEAKTELEPIHRSLSKLFRTSKYIFSLNFHVIRYMNKNGKYKSLWIHNFCKHTTISLFNLSITRTSLFFYNLIVLYRPTTITSVPIITSNAYKFSSDSSCDWKELDGSMGLILSINRPCCKTLI